MCSASCSVRMQVKMLQQHNRYVNKVIALCCQQHCSTCNTTEHCAPAAATHASIAAAATAACTPPLRPPAPAPPAWPPLLRPRLHPPCSSTVSSAYTARWRGFSRHHDYEQTWSKQASGSYGQVASHQPIKQRGLSIKHTHRCVVGVATPDRSSRAHHAPTALLAPPPGVPGCLQLQPPPAAQLQWWWWCGRGRCTRPVGILRPAACPVPEVWCWGREGEVWREQGEGRKRGEGGEWVVPPVAVVVVMVWPRWQVVGVSG